MGVAQTATDSLSRKRWENVRSVSDEVSAYAEEAYDRGSRSIGGGRREVAGAVAEYPLTVVLAVGLAAFGLGLLARGRD